MSPQRVAPSPFQEYNIFLSPRVDIDTPSTLPLKPDLHPLSSVFPSKPLFMGFFCPTDDVTTLQRFATIIHTFSNAFIRSFASASEYQAPIQLSAATSLPRSIRSSHNQNPRPTFYHAATYPAYHPPPSRKNIFPNNPSSPLEKLATHAALPPDNIENRAFKVCYSWLGQYF